MMNKNLHVIHVLMYACMKSKIENNKSGKCITILVYTCKKVY